jgi:hypothetical protein
VTPIASFLDQLLGLRGSLGGAFGALAGAALDLVAAFKNLRQEAVPAGTARRGALAAGFFGAPGAAVTAYKAYREGGSEAAVASLAGSAATMAALKLFSDALTTATAAVGRFAVGLVSPDANPANFVATIGSAVSGVSSTLFAINPALGAFASVLGAGIGVLGDFMRAMDGMVERYAQYSPELAVAQAQAEMVQMMNDIRRSREATPDLLRYIQERTILQQKIEDAKIRFMSQMMPLALDLMKIVESMIPLLQGMFAGVSLLVKASGTLALLKAILDALSKQEEVARGYPEFDLTKMVKEGFVPPGEERGVRTPNI